MFITTCIAIICLQPGARVIDGDSFAVDSSRFRIWGIDAPERGQSGWGEAGEALSELIADQQLACEMHGASWSRIVVRCGRPDGTDIGCAMIASGHAVELTQYSGGAYAGCREEME